MNRRTKQLLYGIFFASIIGVLVLLIIGPIINKAPTCTDGIQNQNETGVDCGDVCGDCYASEIRTPILSAKPIILGSGDNARLIFSVKNPNANFSVSFSYELTSHNLVSSKKITGSKNLRAAENKTIYLDKIPADFYAGQEIFVSLKINDYIPDSVSSLPNLRVREPILTSLEVPKKVTAVIMNESVVNAKEVEVIAILKNEFNTPIFAGYSVLSNIPGGESRNVSVAFPDSLDVADVSSSTTELRLSVY